MPRFASPTPPVVLPEVSEESRPKQVSEKCLTVFRQKPATKQEAKQAKATQVCLARQPLLDLPPGASDHLVLPLVRQGADDGAAETLVQPVDRDRTAAFPHIGALRLRPCPPPSGRSRPDCRRYPCRPEGRPDFPRPAGCGRPATRSLAPKGPARPASVRCASTASVRGSSCRSRSPRQHATGRRQRSDRPRPHRRRGEATWGLHRACPTSR